MARKGKNLINDRQVSPLTEEFLDLIRRLEVAEAFSRTHDQDATLQLCEAAGEEVEDIEVEDAHPEASLYLYWLSTWRRNYDLAVVDSTLKVWIGYLVGRVLWYSQD